jgi:hypothetical protein
LVRRCNALPPSPPPEDIEKVLNIKKKEVAGLESLLNLHKKRA